MYSTVTSHVILYCMKRSLHKCSLTLRHIGHTRTNNGFLKFVEALIYTHSCFFSQSINVRGLPLSACHCLAALSAKTSAFNSLMQQNASHRNIKWTFADLVPCYCYAIKTNSRTIRSRLSQPTSAGKWRDMSELQTRHCMTLQLWTWLLRRVSFIQAKKLSLQEPNQLTGIKIPTSGFTRNISFLIPISRSKCPFCFHCPADAHVIIDYFISGSINKASSSNETTKRFWLIISIS